ncbi:MAG TPA: hypothetical protein VGA44_01515 [Steroidobacteraceae bacterium]
MSAIRAPGTVSRAKVWLLVVLAFALGAVCAAEPAPAAAPVAPDDTLAAAPQRGEQPAAARVAATAPTDPVVDHLKLDSTAITGNRELPKVMSIVPWKPAEPPAGPDRPMGSLIEELLAPVDPAEFRREITYYRGLTSQSSASDAQAAGHPAAAVVPERNRSNPSSPPGASIP